MQEQIDELVEDGSGSACYDLCTSGAGGTGTSYSGGTGGGSSIGARRSTAGNGSSSGGAGGNAGGSGGKKGAGNPGGNNGTGGLLTIYSEILNNNSSIISNGTAGLYAHNPSGSSGGGSINIFYKTSIIKGTITANGGTSVRGEYIGNHGTSYGGAGGNGSISIGTIKEGTYVPFKENATVTLIGNNAKITGASTVKMYNSYTATIEPENGYTISNIIIKIGEETLKLGTDYTYENGTLTVNMVSDDMEITVNTTEITAQNYGQEVDYEANGVSKWKLFYKDDTTNEIFIIASDYLENSKIPEEAGMARINKYQAYFKDIPQYSEITTETRNRFLMKWDNYTNSNSIRCVSKLLDTTIWSSFAAKDNSYAIGSPTIEMWVKSWNEVYPDEKLSYSTDKTADGYYINIGEETQTNTIIDYKQIEKMEGYNNTLYYPHKRRI